MTPDPTRTQRAVWSLFALNGVLYGSWVMQIPAQQVHWQLSPGQLGLLLTALAAGNALAIPAVTALGRRWGPRVTTAAVALTMTGALAAVPVMPSAALTAVALLVYGAGFGGVDLLMNMTGAWLEHRRGQPLLSGLHGAFSAGFLLAGGISVLALRSGVDPRLHLGILAAVGAFGAGVAVRHLPASLRAAHEKKAVPRAAPGWAMIHLMVLAGGAAFVEGLCVDWAAVYLTGQQHATAAQGAAGSVGFAVSMVAVRLSGDSLTRHLGAPRLAVLAGSVLLAGLGLATLHLSVALTQVALLLCGAGVAVLGPLTFSAAGRSGHPAALAWVSGAFLLGFLIAPGVTGAVTQLGGLGLTFVPGLGLAALLLALWTSLARPHAQVT